MDDVIREVQYFLNSGINHSNADYVEGLIKNNGGPEAHPVFNDAAKAIEAVKTSAA